MVHGEVVVLKNGEHVVGGILEGDYKDRMADRLPVVALREFDAAVL